MKYVLWVLMAVNGLQLFYWMLLAPQPYRGWSDEVFYAFMAIGTSFVMFWGFHFMILSKTYFSPGYKAFVFLGGMVTLWSEGESYFSVFQITLTLWAGVSALFLCWKWAETRFRLGAAG